MQGNRSPLASALSSDTKLGGICCPDPSTWFLAVQHVSSLQETQAACMAWPYTAHYCMPHERTLGSRLSWTVSPFLLNPKMNGLCALYDSAAEVHMQSTQTGQRDHQRFAIACVSTQMPDPTNMVRQHLLLLSLPLLPGMHAFGNDNKSTVPRVLTWSHNVCSPSNRPASWYPPCWFIFNTREPFAQRQMAVQIQLASPARSKGTLPVVRKPSQAAVLQ
jgi:hypothetical protein